MTTTATATAPTHAVALTRHDRCDRCNAEAFVRATAPKGHDLLFCGHHYTKYETNLAAAGFHVHDERNRINVAPSISANSE